MLDNSSETLTYATEDMLSTYHNKNSTAFRRANFFYIIFIIECWKLCIINDQIYAETFKMDSDDRIKKK